MQEVKLTKEAEEACENDDDGLTTKHHSGHAGGSTGLEGVLLEVCGIEVVETIVVPQFQNTSSEGEDARGCERPSIRVS